MIRCMAQFTDHFRPPNRRSPAGAWFGDLATTWSEPRKKRKRRAFVIAYHQMAFACASGLLQAASPASFAYWTETYAGELACPCMLIHHFSSVFRRASCRAPTASAGQCSLSGGTPSSAAIRSSVVSLRHSSSVRPTISSVSLDPAAMVGPQP